MSSRVLNIFRICGQEALKTVFFFVVVVFCLIWTDIFGSGLEMYWSVFRPNQIRIGTIFDLAIIALKQSNRQADAG